MNPMHKVSTGISHELAIKNLHHEARRLTVNDDFEDVLRQVKVNFGQTQFTPESILETRRYNYGSRNIFTENTDTTTVDFIYGEQPKRLCVQHSRLYNWFAPDNPKVCLIGDRVESYGFGRMTVFDSRFGFGLHQSVDDRPSWMR